MNNGESRSEDVHVPKLKRVSADIKTPGEKMSNEYKQ